MSKTTYMRSFILFGGGDGGRPEILEIVIIIKSSLLAFSWILSHTDGSVIDHSETFHLRMRLPVS